MVAFELDDESKFPYYKMYIGVKTQRARNLVEKNPNKVQNMSVQKLQTQRKCKYTIVGKYRGQTENSGEGKSYCKYSKVCKKKRIVTVNPPEKKKKKEKDVLVLYNRKVVMLKLKVDRSLLKLHTKRK